MQIFVSVAGIALLIAVAHFKEWSKKFDKEPPKIVEDGKAPRAIGKSILTRTAVSTGQVTADPSIGPGVPLLSR